MSFDFTVLSRLPAREKGSRFIITLGFRAKKKSIYKIKFFPEESFTLSFFTCIRYSRGAGRELTISVCLNRHMEYRT
jgi:hypothetical protein